MYIKKKKVILINFKTSQGQYVKISVNEVNHYANLKKTWVLSVPGKGENRQRFFLWGVGGG